MEYTYTNYLTLNEFKEQTGYDLFKRLELGDFSDSEQAANVFMQDQFNELKGLISSKMGKIWTNNFLSDILTDAATDTTIADMKEAFIEAYKIHCVYRFEVGDAVACADKELPRYSETMIEILTRNHILFRGA